MNDTLAERALAIRAHVLPLIRAHATIERTGHSGIAVWHPGPFRFALRMATADWPAPQSAPAYSDALARQPAASVLPYCLDVWHGPKVMSVEWAETGAFRLLSFKSGEWEGAVRALR